MNFTDEYADIQRKFHIQRPDYGTSGNRYADHVLSIAKRLNTRDILDYGCGKATLQKSIPFPIQNYDPFMDEYKSPPHPADLVVCTDVMEHIEPFAIENVLYEIRDLAKKLVFFQIATCPASKFLPDGRNAHLTQEPINWWLRALIGEAPGSAEIFNISAIQDIGHGFICVCTPKLD